MTLTKIMMNGEMQGGQYDIVDFLWPDEDKMIVVILDGSWTIAV
jgi:hypothetical protein